MEEDTISLLNPDEDAQDVLDLYINDLLGNPDKFYNGLRLKLLVQSKSNSKNNKVIGFVCYQAQKENKDFPLLIRTIAIDPKYRRK